MGRPSKSEKRDHQLNIRLTARELCVVQERANAAGLRPGEFARERVLHDCGKPLAVAGRDGPRDSVFMIQLSRLGNNLNQIARKLNQLGLATPSDLAPLLHELRGLLAQGERHDR